MPTRVRRLKCDERKPFCRRCAAAGRSCGGYDLDLTRKPRALGTRYREKQDVDMATLTPALFADVSGPSICKDLFHHARTCTLQDLETALSPIDFWYSHALPLGHAVDAVKNAICALGGAHRFFKLQCPQNDQVYQEYETVSVQQYNEAIKQVQMVMETATESDLEVILTCCIIFICVENLHGRYAESLRHLKAGTSLLMSHIAQRTKHTPLQTLKDISSASAERRIPKNLDDIAEALCRLGNDVWGYIREMVAPDLNFYSIAVDQLLSPITSFASIDAAEVSFHNVVKLFEADRTISGDAMAWNQNKYNLHEQQFSLITSLTTSSNCIMPFDHLKSIFYHWSARFDLFRRQLDEKHATKQEILRTRVLAVDQALWAGWLRCKGWAEYQQQDCEEILKRAEMLVELDAFQSCPVFAFDGSLIASLTIPCASSVDSEIQWRTIKLLRSMRRREGIWDSNEIADILEAMAIATANGMITRDMLPWDIPHLARLLDSLNLHQVHISQGPLSLIQNEGPFV